MRDLLAVIVVGCDGRPAGAVRQQLGRRSLLALAVEQVAEAAPQAVVASLPDATLLQTARAAGVEALVRSQGTDTLEAALLHALAADIHMPRPPTHLLAVDPLLPLRRPGRLDAAIRLAARERADCVFSCHRESALIWHRSAMGLVPCFDPASRPELGGAGGDLPWLREDGGFYLVSVAALRRTGSRHGSRLMPLETTPEEAVAANDGTGLAVCRALRSQSRRLAAT